MNEYVKRMIVEQAWHQFLYGYNTDERSSFLRDMVEMYPVKIDNIEPVAVYVEDYSLPFVENQVKGDSYQVKTIAREYTSIVLVLAIVEQTMRQIEIEKLNDKMRAFIEAVNRVMINPGFDKIENLNEFVTVLKDAKKFYSDEYVKLLQTGKFQGDISSLKLSFVDLNFFVNYYKKALNMNSHFSILIDQQRTGSFISQQAINGIITKRCTGDISMKVACRPDEWKTYYDLTGMFAESVHDYSVVELDDSFPKYVKELRDKRMI